MVLEDLLLVRETNELDMIIFVQVTDGSRGPIASKRNQWIGYDYICFRLLMVLEDLLLVRETNGLDMMTQKQPNSRY